MSWRPTGYLYSNIYSCRGKGAIMRQSACNIWVSDYPEPGKNLVYNSRSQAILVLNRQMRRALENLETIQNSLPAFLAEHIPALQANGIIVDSAEAEARVLDGFFKKLQFGSTELPFEVTVLTTYSCNFKCVYCFEESVKEPVFLDQSTSGQIVSWIKEKVKERGFKKVFIVYYGGEPLMNIRPVYDISWQLQEWCRDQEVVFKFGIISNGSLVNRSLIEKLLSVGLEEIRVTLDGDRAAHDRKRPFADGSPSFDLIVENIKQVIDVVKVSVTGNFDQDNVESIPGLLDHLAARGLLYKLNMIDFAPLSARLGPKDNPAAIELGNCLSFFDKNGMQEEILRVKKELLRRKLKVNVGLDINACSLTMHNGGVAIDPKGVIYKCNALIGYPEFSVGTVQQGFNERYDRFLRIEAWKKCPQDCPYLPLCQGGCRFFSYLEKNTLTDICCKKDYLDRLVPELIKLEYDQLVSRSRQEVKTEQVNR